MSLHNPILIAAIALTMNLASPVAATPVQDAIDLVNQARKSAGRRQLDPSPALTQAAQKHADELFQRGYGTTLKSGGHKSRNGMGVRQRANRAGFKACYIVENLGWGQKTAEVVVAEWMRSALHKKNILDRKLKHIGIGFAEPKTWVLVAAKEC